MHENGSKSGNDIPARPAYHEFGAIARFLGESPETVIPLHMLRNDACNVICVGSPHNPEGIVIQSTLFPEEPMAFGGAEAIASILPVLSGWTCINVPAAIADSLKEDVRRTADAPLVHVLEDAYHILETRPSDLDVPGVRLMAPGDGDLFGSAPDELDGVDEKWLLGILGYGHVAGAIRGGQVVSIAHTFALSEVYADIGVRTIGRWRRQGLATAASAVVAQAIQRDGRTPVWSCGGKNIASLAVAARLRFR